MKRRLCLCLTALALSLQAASAHAAGPNDEARDLFNAGAKAYSVGQFEQAVKYLDAAYALSPQPAILFSLSQALRRQYAKDSNPHTLARALAGFRSYLEQVPQGARVADAAAAVTELEALARSRGEELPAPSAPSDPQRAELIVTSGTPGAIIEVDGQRQQDEDGAQLREYWSGSLSPGEHTVRVLADGYVEQLRAVRLTAGRPHALDLVLVAKPPRVLLSNAPAGARVEVDGRWVGDTPLRVLELPAGAHVVRVGKRGYVGSAHELSLARGQTLTLNTQLNTSTQRKIAYGFAGGGVLSLGASVGFFGAALAREQRAEDLRLQRRSGALTRAQHDEYDDARADRTRYRAAGAAWLGVSASVLAVGALLYFFDQPRFDAPKSTGLRLRGAPQGLELQF